MDKIVEIQRKGGVARVKFLSGEQLKIPSALYLERRLREGDVIDPEAYRAFMLNRGYPHALEAAMKFLALRERSEKEICQRLRRSCYDKRTIARVMDTLSAHALVSDARFAEQWVHHRGKKYGKNRIAQELKIKGVSGEEAKMALETLPEEEEFARALEQAQKLARRMKDDPNKIIQALVRRGYSWSMAKRAVNAL
ncbi:MAG: regulatory protein RecX [Clostridiales bacterium]|nr:regulatory protein RecX [Clostridiales bacterium]